MRQNIADKLATIPAEPGVYLMKDAHGEVFYVGKAKSLRDRLRSYFSGTDTRAFVALLEHLLDDIEVVLTHSEKEALLVEDDLIKRYQPRFNVELKDDKRFLCLRLDTRTPYPRLEVVRRFGKDGARYFGPYTSASAVRETLRLVNRHFQLRTCSDGAFASRTRPCLQYQIKRCPAPCVFDLSHGEYAQNVENVARFLGGEGRELLDVLRARMRQRAAELSFEAAAQLRDQIGAIERSLEHQRVVTSDFANRDVVGLYREGPAVEIHVMRVREGRLVDAERYSFEGLEIPTSELLSDFAVRYYASESEVPAEILFPPEMEWDQALAELLAEKAGRQVEVRSPQRGDKRRLVELAARNAAQAFRDKQREKGAARSAVERLQRALHLARTPRTLECFDISHLGGTSIVASAIRFEDGVPRKELYRQYKIRSTASQDDFQSLYEVVSRRVRRGVEEGNLPDLIVIDGGKGQLNAARAALEDNAVDGVDVIALAKAKLDDAPAVPVPGTARQTAASESPAGAGAKLAPEGTGRPAAIADATSDSTGDPAAIAEATSDGTGRPAAIADATRDGTGGPAAITEATRERTGGPALAPGAGAPAPVEGMPPAVAAIVAAAGTEPDSTAGAAPSATRQRRRGRATAHLSGTPDRVFVLGQKNPVLLGENSAELFLLTRARDEAHRFAIGFQRRSRKRAMTRTELDDIPGVGATRRRALLRAFGSVTRLRAASEAEVTEVVGPKTAAAVLAHLHGAKADGQS